MKFGNILVGKRLFVGDGKPKALGKGASEVRGSAYVEGPLQVGRDSDYSTIEATVMIGEEDNSDSLPNRVATVQDIEDGVESPARLVLKCKGNVHIDGYGKTGQTLKINSWCGNAIDINDGTVWIDDSGEAMFKAGTSGKTMSDRFNESDEKPKPFDLVHPSKGKGNRLRYACIEGPEVGVYYRGRVRNRHNVITLPDYWKDLVHTDSISVQLQPIGAHQNVIVKRWDNEKIYLQAQGGMPVDCFFHVYAERKDVNKLVTEYEGDSWKDYPDPEYNDPKYGGQNTVTG
tara:strand:- start:213 stop:1076 length:864 start_codon:yes stop_codon:yes gene_type:complete